MTRKNNAESRSARIRGELGYPVIDGDGHFLELLPLLGDFIRDHGRGDIVEAVPSIRGGAFTLKNRELSADERRRRRGNTAFWGAPADAEYFATVTSPAKYYERLGEAGIDFSVVYPTLGQFYSQPDDDQRITLCRLYNEFTAELFGPYSDRFTVPAVIPMHTPAEAIAELEHAHRLGAKVALIPSYVRRPMPGEALSIAPGSTDGPVPHEGWLDTYGIDSLFDYDPVWAKAIELGFPLAAHSIGRGMGFGERWSISNFLYDHIGHFQAAGEMLAKSLFFGGVTRRFPRLRVALLEGGVAHGVRIYNDLVSTWGKRGGQGLKKLNPDNIDRGRLAQLLAESEPRMARYAPEDIISVWGSSADEVDDFAAAGIESPEDIRDRFCTNFAWGCEADDRLAGLAFNPRVTALGARLPAFMASDIGHWDVPDFDSPLEEAYELVEDGILDPDSFRDFVFTNALRFYGALNPDFFAGTAIESEALAAR